ncbi:MULTISPECIES: response regulator [Halorussus]|uniref:response regulator n=1 Tax=Halorussus TaxID=1070314 RepID=UPI0020A14D47|nr:HalX domain-containing protein [Halorussus vallis]USZ78269.1 HalX domain-containing protein [Halorussus vallis]
MSESVQSDSEIGATPDDATVLIVDDEQPITDAYAQWLENDYEVRTAYSGSEALEELDEAVDVVLLDRRMPDLSGEDVLAEIHEQGLTCRVALVSAVEPDFDILELGFDAYLEKPVSEARELRETVETLLRRSTYDAQMQQFLSLATKKAALESKKSQEDLEANDEYAAMQSKLADLREQLSTTATQMDDEDLRAEFYDPDE